MDAWMDGWMDGRHLLVGEGCGGVNGIPVQIPNTCVTHNVHIEPILAPLGVCVFIGEYA